MSIHEGPRAYKIEASEAPSYQMLGCLWRVLATGDETGGLVGALDEINSQGLRAPMHVHDDADEIFYVVDGNITFFVGDQRIEAAAGAFVYLPRFVHHGFQVNSEEARLFNFLTPAGFERMIVDNGQAAHFDDAPILQDPNVKPAMPSDVKKYGMRLLPPGSK